MKNLNFLKLFLATIFVTTTALFAGCVDDNDDTEAPRLEISPKTLVFNDEGFPVDGSQDYFEISANRKMTRLGSLFQRWKEMVQIKFKSAFRKALQMKPR